MEQNDIHNDETQESKKRILVWWRHQQWSRRILSLIGLMAVLVAVAYAATLVWDNTYREINPPKDLYVDVKINGIPESFGSIRPGGTVSAAPVIVNDGDIGATAFVTLSLPLKPGSTTSPLSAVESAYDFTPDSSWTEIDRDVEDGKLVVVYGYGGAELKELGAGESTEALVNGFTLKSNITGSQFGAMQDISIGVRGWLASEDYGVDPKTVWEQRVE